MRCRHSVLLAFAATCVTAACSRGPVPPEMPPVPDTPPANTQAGPAGRRELLHDFGVLLPAANVYHQFMIRNDTAVEWALEQVHSSCGCAVAELNAKTVPPGESVTATVGYKAPGDLGDDRRTVTVSFSHGDGKTVVALGVRARVRLPVSLFPTVLRVNAGHDRPAITSLEVYSYTAEVSLPPCLVADAPWASFGEPMSLPRPVDDPYLVWRWQVPVTLAADRLGPGMYRCEVTVAAGTPHNGEVRVPIELSVAAPIAVSPGQIFFGDVAVGRPSSVIFRVSTPPGYPASNVAVEHDLGPAFETQVVSASPKVVLLRATLTPTVPGDLAGNAVLNLPGLPSTTVPVLARAR